MGKKRTRQTGTLNLPGSTLKHIYQHLFECYGPQHWWPGDSPFEVMVGAVLTQNTAWSNVERAIANLKREGLLELNVMLVANVDALAAQIRPAGYFNVKAKRLLSLCRFLAENTGLEQMSDAELRASFIAVHGIGPETADDILLYAFNRPVFVIDAYTRRLFSRLGLIEEGVGYEALRLGFEQALDHQTDLFKEYHALIVRHAKEICRSKPLCDQCCLGSQCRAFTAASRNSKSSNKTSP